MSPRKLPATDPPQGWINAGQSVAGWTGLCGGYPGCGATAKIMFHPTRIDQMGVDTVLVQGSSCAT